jgi:hypothetical protein
MEIRLWRRPLQQAIAAMLKFLEQIGTSVLLNGFD